MRELLRGCLVWFVGYPLSSVAAAAVLTGPVWTTSQVPFDTAVRMVLGAAPVVGLFALLPALLTPPSSRIWPYVAAGTRTGAWCGALTVSMFTIVFVAVTAQEMLKALARGHVSAEPPQMLLTMAGWIVGAVALFAVAGAIGGFVFGLAAAEPARDGGPPSASAAPLI